MNIQQFTEEVQSDLDNIAGLEKNAIMDMMKTIMRIVDKHAKELTREDMIAYICNLPHDNKVWDDILVLRVCTLEDAIREAMVISACGSILEDYVERAKL
jgi:hypothetical protein